METLDKASKLLELHQRRSICSLCITILEKENDDPRKFEALRQYHREFDELQALITELDPADIPRNVNVELNSATLNILAAKE